MRFPHLTVSKNTLKVWFIVNSSVLSATVCREPRRHGDEISFPWRGSWMEHNLWNTGKGVPVIADNQKQGGHCSGQPALADAVQGEGLD